MRTTLIILLMAILLGSCKKAKTRTDEHQHSENKMDQVETTKKKVLSPHTSAMAMIGDAHIHIDYSSPGVRGRIVFGGLVGYDNVWQAGAHNATWIETNKNLIIAGKELEAGKYGFFVIPNQEEWTVIFNSNWDQHGKDEYDEKDDIIRFKVKPFVSDSITEQLEYKVTKTNETGGIVSLSWEKITISFPLKFKE